MLQTISKTNPALPSSGITRAASLRAANFGVMLALLLLCLLPRAWALSEQAADIAAVRVHFPAITATEFNRLDRPLRQKLASGEIPELIIVFKTTALAGAPTALAKDNLSKEQRRALRIQLRDQRSAQIISMQRQLERDIRKKSPVVEFVQSYEHIPLARVSVSGWRDMQQLLHHTFGVSTINQYQVPANAGRKLTGD